MSYGNAYSQYKEQSINTMTSGELLVLLYDEVIKRMNRAKLFAENNDMTAFDADVLRSREIIQYFEQSLDRKYAISAELLRLYDYMMYELSRARAGRKTEPIDNILPIVTELRDTWKEADRLSRMKQ